jgi:hypothetical protein
MMAPPHVVPQPLVAGQHLQRGGSGERRAEGGFAGKKGQQVTTEVTTAGKTKEEGS